MAEKVVEFEGPTGACAIGATIAFSASSSSESERAVTKLSRSEPASSKTVETSCWPAWCDTGGHPGRISTGEMFKGGRTGG